MHKTKSGGLRFTHDAAIPNETPKPFTAKEKENVKKGLRPYAPAEPLNTAADSRKR